MIAEKRVIKDGDDIWDELERTITDVSPEFVKNLNAVTKGKLTEAEMRTAFLIKLGFSPTQIASLSGKSRGAIVSRRESICIKIFGAKMGAKAADDIIRSL